MLKNKSSTFSKNIKFCKNYLSKLTIWQDHKILEKVLDKKLIFIYLLIILSTSGCLNFKNNNNNQPSAENQNQNVGDYKSSWLDKSPTSNNETDNPVEQTETKNDNLPLMGPEDIMVNGIPQPRPTLEADIVEREQLEEYNKVADIALKYISSSKEYLRLSRSLPRVTSVSPRNCTGCFGVSVEYDILDTENPNSDFLIKFVDLEIANWQVIAPLDI